MRVILEVISGPDSRRTVTIPPGPPLRVGRRPPVEFVLTGDQSLSRSHFALESDGRTCRVRDLNSTYGTLVNGAKVSEAILQDGDEIQAGATRFLVHIERAPAPLLDDAPLTSVQAIDAPLTSAPVVAALDPLSLVEDESHRRVIRALREPGEPLFAVLDAARDPLVYARLLECKEQYQSLYEGPKAEELALVAPYLVALPALSPFLATVVRDGWGQSWGIYLTTDRPFPEVRKHLRRFLLVKTEDGEELLFRYYDPRVLRTFLPTCTPEELAKFFGPIRSCLLEGPDPGTMLRFNLDGRRLNLRALPLDDEPEVENLTTAEVDVVA
jgi:pSer/pThr/pTyr-binding forkhead associated (FHA) protein